MKTDASRQSWIVLSFYAALCLSPAQAHHSTAAEFDPGKPVTFTGTVRKVMWMNPHIYTQIEVKQNGAASMVYHVEGNAPNTLFRQGWRADSLKVGDVVTVSGLAFEESGFTERRSGHYRRRRRAQDFCRRRAGEGQWRVAPGQCARRGLRLRSFPPKCVASGLLAAHLLNQPGLQ